jgi:hypothetical protein
MIVHFRLLGRLYQFLVQSQDVLIQGVIFRHACLQGVQERIFALCVPKDGMPACYTSGGSVWYVENIAQGKRVCVTCDNKAGIPDDTDVMAAVWKAWAEIEGI